MRRREADYLVALCRAYLEEETPRLRQDIDYKTLYAMAHSHNLSAVIFCVLNQSENREAVPPEVLRQFQNDFFEAVIRYDIQAQVKEALEAVWAQRELRHIYFKGVELKELYPVPQARVMGDIDVLIRAQDNAAARAALTENGFRAVNLNGPVQDYSRDGVKIEVHTKIISGRVGSSNAEAAFGDAFDHGVFSGCSGMLDTDYHAAYLIAHLAHHFAFFGAGVKLILDLAVLLKRRQVSLDSVMEKLREAGLEQFGKVILSVCRQWFGYGEDYRVDTEETKAFLLRYGAFGNANRDTAAVMERRDMEEGRQVSPLRSRLRLLFPSYSRVKEIPYIRFIDGRPYLLPYAWIYRIVYNLRHRRAHMTGTAKGLGSADTKRRADEEMAFFETIGLR